MTNSIPEQANIQELQQVANSMNSFARITNPMSVITVGDNFYNSVSSYQDEKFKTLWLDVFREETGR